MTKKRDPGIVLASLRTHIEVMNQMMQRRGGTASFPSSGKAYNFRHDCYRARKLLREQAKAHTPFGQIVTTPYDDLYILIENETLIFKLRSADPMPMLVFNDEPKEEVSDEWEKAAADLKRQIF